MTRTVYGQCSAGGFRPMKSLGRLSFTLLPVLREAVRVVAAATILLLVAMAAAAGQNLEKVPRIGFLAVDPPPPKDPGFFNAFRQGMSELGYIEGRTVVIETRFANGDMDSLNVMAAELVRLRVDVLVSDSTIATAAAKRATTSIPIVFATAADPAAAGIVSSLGHRAAISPGLPSYCPSSLVKDSSYSTKPFPRSCGWR